MDRGLHPVAVGSMMFHDFAVVKITPRGHNALRQIVSMASQLICSETQSR